jgi:predicted house-cleaning NTP pyrophosphatase (Maf/HAM1 superfamily)
MCSSLLTEAYKVLLRDHGDNSALLTAICLVTQETFTVRQHHFRRIKPITIEVALQKESPALECNCVNTKTSSCGRRRSWN